LESIFSKKKIIVLQVSNFLAVKVGLPLSREINNSMKRQGDGRYWAANPYDLLPLCGAVIPLK